MTPARCNYGIYDGDAGYSLGRCDSEPMAFVCRETSQNWNGRPQKLSSIHPLDANFSQFNHKLEFKPGQHNSNESLSRRDQNDERRPCSWKDAQMIKPKTRDPAGEPCRSNEIDTRPEILIYKNAKNENRRTTKPCRTELPEACVLKIIISDLKRPEGTPAMQGTDSGASTRNH